MSDPDTARREPDEFEWSPARLETLDERFRERPPQELVRWAVGHFGPDLALATSFGPQTVVLMHMAVAIDPRTTIFYLDTDLLFPETYALRDELAQRLSVTFTRVPASLPLQGQEAIYGARLWTREPERCCYLRKILPLQRFLSGRRAWISGVRRSQTDDRAGARIVEWDSQNALVKLNPLAGWTDTQVWDYVRKHELPSNRLHREGYPSIGCQPCTRPVAPGEDPRSGRWAGTRKTECGIHLDPVGSRRSRGSL